MQSSSLYAGSQKVFLKDCSMLGVENAGPEPAMYLTWSMK